MATTSGRWLHTILAAWANDSPDINTAQEMLPSMSLL
jgi:hypothetical protein